MKKSKMLSLLICGMFSMGTATSCDGPSANDLAYRLSETGATFANAFVDSYKLARKKYKDWGIQPKNIDIMDQSAQYSAGDVVNASSASTLNFRIPYSQTMTPGTDQLFLIGVNNSIVLNTDFANGESTGYWEPLIYPSSTLSPEVLNNGSYDLTGSYPDNNKIFDTNVFNMDQEVVVNYKLVDNSGILSKPSFETNFHFIVSLSNDQELVGALSELNCSYASADDELYEDVREKIATAYASKNINARLTAELFKDSEGAIAFDVNELAVSKMTAMEDKTYSISLFYRVSDSDGNKTEILPLTVKLIDDVAPYILDKTGVEAESIDIGIDEIYFGTDDGLKMGAAKALKQTGYVVGDEINSVEISPYVSNGYLYYRIIDAAGNVKEYPSKTKVIESREFIDNETGIKYEMFGGVAYIKLKAKGYHIDGFTNLDMRYVLINGGTFFEERLSVTNLSDSYFYIANTDCINIIFGNQQDVKHFFFYDARVVNIFLSKDTAVGWDGLVFNYVAKTAKVNIYIESNEKEFKENPCIADRFYLANLAGDTGGYADVHINYDVSLEDFKAVVGW